MLIRLGPGGATEAGGGRDGAAHTGGGGYDIEQVKGDVFIAAGSKARGGEGVHREISPKRMLPDPGGRFWRAEYAQPAVSLEGDRLGEGSVYGKRACGI